VHLQLYVSVQLQLNKMKITANKIKRILIKEHGWEMLNNSLDCHYISINELMRDIVKIIDQKLKDQKGMSIRK